MLVKFVDELQKVPSGELVSLQSQIRCLFPNDAGSIQVIFALIDSWLIFDWVCNFAKKIVGVDDEHVDSLSLLPEDFASEKTGSVFINFIKVDWLIDWMIFVFFFSFWFLDTEGRTPARGLLLFIIIFDQTKKKWKLFFVASFRYFPLLIVKKKTKIISIYLNSFILF